MPSPSSSAPADQFVLIRSGSGEVIPLYDATVVLVPAGHHPAEALELFRHQVVLDLDTRTHGKALLRFAPNRLEVEPFPVE